MLGRGRRAERFGKPPQGDRVEHADLRAGAGRRRVDCFHLEFLDVDLGAGRGFTRGCLDHRARRIDRSRLRRDVRAWLQPAGNLQSLDDDAAIELDGPIEVLTEIFSRDAVLGAVLGVDDREPIGFVLIAFDAPADADRLGRLCRFLVLRGADARRHQGDSKNQDDGAHTCNIAHSWQLIRAIRRCESHYNRALFRTIGLRWIAAALVFVTVAPLGVVAGLSVQRAWRRQLSNVDNQNIATVRAISVAIDQYLEKTTAALDVLGELHALDVPALEAFKSLASRILPYQPQWSAILLADPAGRLLDGVPDSATAAGAGEWARAASASRK